MDSIKVGLVIKEILSSSEELKAIVGDKIYPLIAPADEYPFVVYRRSGSIPEDSKDRRIISSESTIEICSVSDDYGKAVEIASLVGDALVRRKGVISGINVADITYDGDDEDYIEGAFIQRTFFKIKVR